VDAGPVGDDAQASAALPRPRVGAAQHPQARAAEEVAPAQVDQDIRLGASGGGRQMLGREPAVAMSISPETSTTVYGPCGWLWAHGLAGGSPGPAAEPSGGSAARSRDSGGIAAPPRRGRGYSILVATPHGRKHPYGTALKI
jgi:hypothetical protein